jgi:elongation factor Ts
MTEISATLVKELREETNVGMMECKRALVEAKGDKAQAVRILRERGIAIAQKKSSRSTNQGVIAAALLPNGQAGSLIEVNCETDFVAKNEKVKAFVQSLAEQAAAADINLAESAAAGITAKIAEIGENIVARRNLRYAIQGPGRVAAYIHHGSTIGVLLEAACQKETTLQQPAFQELLKDLCLHITASSPRFLDRQAVPPDVIAAEREIYAKQITGKPANIVAKIVDGKMNKFYEQVCLVDQLFVKDQDKRVSVLLKEKNTALNDTVSIRRFARFQVGEKTEKQAAAATN